MLHASTTLITEGNLFRYRTGFRQPNPQIYSYKRKFLERFLFCWGNMLEMQEELQHTCRWHLDIQMEVRLR